MIRLLRLPAGSLGRSRLPGMVSGLVLAVILIQAVSVRLGGIGDRLGWIRRGVDRALDEDVPGGGPGLMRRIPGGFRDVTAGKGDFRKRHPSSAVEVGAEVWPDGSRVLARGMAFRQWGLIFNLLLTLASIGLVYRLGLTVAGSRPGALAGAFVFRVPSCFRGAFSLSRDDVAISFAPFSRFKIMTWYMRTGQGFALCAGLPRLRPSRSG